MTGQARFFSGWAKRAVRTLMRGGLNTGGLYYGRFHLVNSGADPEKRWKDLSLVADFRPADRVLDVGCAEGLISLEIAKRVAQVDGVEVEAQRVERAKIEAAKRGIKNVCFSVGSAIGYAIEPNSYDVVLLLSVLGKGDDSGRIGLPELERLLVGTKRQFIMCFNILKYRPWHPPLADIIATMDKCGFDGICFSQGKTRPGNLIVGHRRGADARLDTAPPLVIVPTENVSDHPCLRGARIGSLQEFA